MGSNLAFFDGGVVGWSSDDLGFLSAFDSAVLAAVAPISLVTTALIAVLLLSERLEGIIHRRRCNLCGKWASVSGQSKKTVRKIVGTLLLIVVA